MAIIQVTLDEDEIIEACRYWATTHVLNEGRPLSCEITSIVDQGRASGTINKAVVYVKTERMKKSQEQEP